MIASYHNKERICRLFISRGANIHTCDDSYCTPMYWAVYHANTSLINLLLSKGARADTTTKHGITLLGLAKIHESAHIVSLLEDHFVAINLSGVISRGLDDGHDFSDFLVKGICDCRLFLIVANFAYH